MSQQPLGDQLPVLAPADVPLKRAVVPAAAPAAPVDLKDVQGDIFPNFPKKVEKFLFFVINDIADFRARLGEFIPLLATADKVRGNLEAIQRARTAKSGLVPLAQYQIAFAQAIFADLGIGKLQDAHFDKGRQILEAEELGDPPTFTGAADSFDPNWESVWKDNTFHGVIVAASESLPTCNGAVQQVKEIFDCSISIVHEVEGDVRKDLLNPDGTVKEKREGHEHFGFLDGVSAPALNGLVVPHPGQRPCEPGVIIMGYEGDPALNPRNPSAPKRPEWAKGGSIMVFRKLRQFVPEFSRYLVEHPVNLPGLDDEAGSQLRGAKMVGRWKSGMPIDLAQVRDLSVDDPSLLSPDKINNFDYLRPAQGQDRCPFSAHIRKTQPRLDFLNGIQIMRAGIPYGPEVTEREAHTQVTTEDRGLLFVCYQSSLDQGFHFMQTAWANATGFPPNGPPFPQGFQSAAPGFDPIVGNAVGSARLRKTSGTDPDDQADNLVMTQDFVAATGGEYFFVPPKSTLERISAGERLE